MQLLDLVDGADGQGAVIGKGQAAKEGDGSQQTWRQVGHSRRDTGAGREQNSSQASDRQSTRPITRGPKDTLVNKNEFGGINIIQIIKLYHYKEYRLNKRYKFEDCDHRR